MARATLRSRRLVSIARRGPKEYGQTARDEVQEAEYLLAQDLLSDYTPADILELAYEGPKQSMEFSLRR